jgi:glycosyltransferase involved in cell wall biosynthesis
MILREWISLLRLARRRFQSWKVPLRVCYFGTYRSNYSRNQIMIEGLRRNNVEVIECHEQLWYDIKDRIQVASGGWLRPAFLWRAIRTYYRLILAHRQVEDYAIMVLGYPGQLDVWLARVLTWLRRKPLVLDVFMSIYLIASERGLVARYPFTGWLIHLAEKWACRLPDRLILDTAEYVEWFCQTYGLDPNRFYLVPTGADDRVFRPLPVPKRCDEKFDLVYYGTFIPNHGVLNIVEAARILQDEPDIRFELIGEGPTKTEALALARRHGLGNVTFPGWVDKDELPRRVARADVCLGVFGTTPQSQMTVQNKIYEGLAMKKPVITGDSLTVNKALTHGQHVYLCERNNPQSLANAILTLRDDPALRDRLAEAGHRRYQREFTTAALGQLIAEHLRGTVSEGID